MIKVLAVPEIGNGIEKVQITRLLKAPGEGVKMDEPLYEQEHDKAAHDVPSPYDAVVLRWWVAEGDVAVIGQPVVDLQVED